MKHIGYIVLGCAFTFLTLCDARAYQLVEDIPNLVQNAASEVKNYAEYVQSVSNQVTQAMQNLNSAATQVETQKYAAQINGIHAQMNALTGTTNLTGQRAAVQQLSNANDAARVQEASRQQEMQERATDLQNEANGFSALIGGGTNP